MSMMNYIKVCFLCFWVFLLGCVKEKDDFVRLGTVELQITQNETVNIKKSGEQSVLLPYSIKIVSADGSTVYEAEDISQVEAPINIKEGSYTLNVVTKGVQSFGFDKPCYTGTADFTVVAGETVQVPVTCTLSNVKISIAFSNTIKNNFLEYSADVVTGGQELHFAANETRSGYIAAASFDVRVNLKDVVGRVHTFTNTFTDAKPRDHYKIVVDLATDIGTGGINITVDPTTYDKICDISIPNVPIVKTLPSVGTITAPVLRGIGLALDREFGFEYKRSKDEAWVKVDPALVTRVTDEAGIVHFQASVTGIPMDAKVEYRATLGSSVGNVESFVTAEMLPNLNFDVWTQSGKTYFPNADTKNSFWATGNEGVTMSLVNKDSNTRPTDDVAQSGGSAARMETISVPFVNIAAGNLFTGTYKTNISDPASSVTFGRPYSYRPKALQGYYKYAPKVIDVARAPHEDKKGQMDQCHIYLRLEDWGGATSRPSNPTVVGYGEFKSSEAVGAYKKFEFDIEYYSAVRPTHVVLVATSSIYGGEFTGGIGSTLYVDNFELIFE